MTGNVSTWQVMFLDDRQCYHMAGNETTWQVMLLRDSMRLCYSVTVLLHDK